MLNQDRQISVLGDTMSHICQAYSMITGYGILRNSSVYRKHAVFLIFTLGRKEGS